MDKVTLGRGIALIERRLGMDDDQLAGYCEMSRSGILLWKRDRVKPTKMKAVNRLRELAARAGIEIEGL